MLLRIGTSGFSYKEWKGTFYPAKIKPAEMLPFYAGQFCAVEINNTFHRMPKPELLESWAAQVPEGFAFALKAPQRITHASRLVVETSADATERFLDVARGLDARLGPLLFQCPPYLKRDVPRLAAFLRLLPREVRAAFEFRDASWFDEEVYATLREAGAALCIAEDEARRTEPVATAPWGYLRLRRPDYDATSLAAWADWIRGQAWSEAYVFFKHEDEAKGPAFAKQFEAHAERAGLARPA